MNIDLFSSNELPFEVFLLGFEKHINVSENDKVPKVRTRP
jgi:hypothetical protein